jgi:hypothetical protein
VDVDRVSVAIHTSSAAIRRDFGKRAASCEHWMSLDSVRTRLNSLSPEKLALLSRRLRSLTINTETANETSAEQTATVRGPHDRPKVPLPLNSRAGVDVEGLSDRAVESILMHLIDIQPLRDEPTPRMASGAVTLRLSSMSNAEMDAVLEQMISASALELTGLQTLREPPLEQARGDDQKASASHQFHQQPSGLLHCRDEENP